MDIMELLRLLRAGESERTITRSLHHNRRTIARYRAWAAEQGFLDGGSPLPPAAEIQARLAQTLPPQLPPQQTSTVSHYADEIVAYRARGLEAAAIRSRLEEIHGEPVSYSALWRFIRRRDRAEAAASLPGPHDAFVRVEVPPGSEAQVDFGYAGLAIDPATGQPRKSWVFVMVLSCSRHQYAEIVFDQRVETWLLCHAHAFASFGGVPARIVPDNLKAAIVRASFTEPVAQRAYRECAEHYGFLIDPTPPRSPHLKGKVENGVHYVKRNFLAGRELEALPDRNAKLQRWTRTVAGVRMHGTIKAQPLERFRAVEQPALRPLPPVPYDPATWSRALLYRDCHVSFEQSYYSAPYRLVGQQLWVRGGARTVELYTADHQLVATHARATGPGERKTDPLHLPPEKVPGLVLNRADCQLQAETTGPHVAAIVGRMLAHRPEDRLRMAQRLLHLGDSYGGERLEHACRRAEQYGSGDYPSVKRILELGLDAEADRTAEERGSDPEGGRPLDSMEGARAYAFVRQAGDFMASLVTAGLGAMSR
jgi:transposase